MKNIYIGLGILVVIVIGWLSFFNDAYEYNAVTVDEEITALENDLAGLDVEVTAGTLTPEKALASHVKITNRVDTISSAMQESNKANLTAEQKVQLSAGLERLKNILLKYQTTLVAVDTSVQTLPEAQRPKSKHGGGNLTLVEAVTVSVSEVEEVVSDEVDDYDETPIEQLFEENTSTESADDSSMSWSEDGEQSGEATGTINEEFTGTSSEDGSSENQDQLESDTVQIETDSDENTEVGIESETEVNPINSN